MAFFSFNTCSICIAIIRRFADARWRAFDILALVWYLRYATDEINQWTVTTGDAILSGTAVAVNFAIAWTLISRRWYACREIAGTGDDRFCVVAISFQYADTFCISEISFFAKATNNAMTAAERARVWVLARRWTTAAA